MSDIIDSVNDTLAQRATHWEYSAAATPDLKDIPIEFFHYFPIS